jgi:hypothetical protein
MTSPPPMMVNIGASHMNRTLNNSGIAPADFRMRITFQMSHYLQIEVAKP